MVSFVDLSFLRVLFEIIMHVGISLSIILLYIQMMDKSRILVLPSPKMYRIFVELLRSKAAEHAQGPEVANTHIACREEERDV